MAIPTNVHVPRFVAACFGISLHGELEPSHLQDAVVAIGTALGASPEESNSFWERAQGHIMTIAQSLADGKKAISQDRLIQEQFGLLVQWLESLGKERGREVAAMFEQWVTSRLIIPPEDFLSLFLFFSAFWSAGKTPDDTSRTSTMSAKILGQLLFLVQPVNMAQALKVWRPVPNFPTEQLNKAYMQTQSRIMRNAVRGLTAVPEKDVEAQREAIDYMIRAWHDAYETTIYNVCLLFWLVKRRPGKALDPAQAPTQKGVLYEDVVKWFDANGIPFPFYKHLPWVRNPSGHASWAINDDLRSVTFSDNAKQREHEMSFEDIRNNAFSDIITANTFAGGLTLALLAQDNAAGRYDGAWGRLAAKVDTAAIIDENPDPDDDD